METDLLYLLWERRPWLEPGEDMWRVWRRAPSVQGGRILSVLVSQQDCGEEEKKKEEAVEG